MMIGCNITSKFFQQFGIGLQQGFLFSAVKPVLHFEGFKFHPVSDHTFDGIRQIVFPITRKLIADIIFKTGKKCFGFTDLVNSDKCHIRFGYLRFFNHPADESIIFNFGHTEIPGIIYSFYTQR